MEHVLVVNAQDEVIGTMEKMEAHRTGTLHRAFSVLVFNSRGEMLIQKRAHTKYHSPALWTNACCSHPRPEEDILDAGKRRLKEEMGIDATPVFAYKFTYKTIFNPLMIEHEVDHVLVATYDGSPTVNQTEVEDWKFVSMEELKKDIAADPQRFTSWFKLIMDHKHPVPTL